MSQTLFSRSPSRWRKEFNFILLPLFRAQATTMLLAPVFFLTVFLLIRYRLLENQEERCRLVRHSSTIKHKITWSPNKFSILNNDFTAFSVILSSSACTINGCYKTKPWLCYNEHLRWYFGRRLATGIRVFKILCLSNVLCRIRAPPVCSLFVQNSLQIGGYYAAQK